MDRDRDRKGAGREQRPFRRLGFDQDRLPGLLRGYPGQGPSRVGNERAGDQGPGYLLPRAGLAHRQPRHQGHAQPRPPGEEEHLQGLLRRIGRRILGQRPSRADRRRAGRLQRLRPAHREQRGHGSGAHGRDQRRPLPGRRRSAAVPGLASHRIADGKRRPGHPGLPDQHGRGQAPGDLREILRDRGRALRGAGLRPRGPGRQGRGGYGIAAFPCS